jgi:murein DD-endopeptidase MepM/ murein hydrolase activator NlpD
MLIRNAQPTSQTRTHTEGAFEQRLSAAGSWLLATIAILLTLALPHGAAAAEVGGGAWPWPLLGEVITPYKNGSDRFAAGQHRGLDIAAPAGTPVRAIVDGRVTFAGTLPDGGVTVTVRSHDGAYLVSDLHLVSRAVSRGATVAAGETLGAVGTTGKRSVTQPHLHLSVRRAADRSYLDPMSMLGPPHVAQPPARPEPKVQLAELEPKSQSINSVHAHSTGDISPAQSQVRLRHGASSQPTTADRSAGARAREGHAARQISRVAPPPLKQAAPARVKVAIATPVRPAVQRPERHSARSRGSGTDRLLLLAVAAVCLLALVMRRTPRRAQAPLEPPAPVGAEETDARFIADVIPIHRAS